MKIIFILLSSALCLAQPQLIFDQETGYAPITELPNWSKVISGNMVIYNSKIGSDVGVFVSEPGSELPRRLNINGTLPEYAFDGYDGTQVDSSDSLVFFVTTNSNSKTLWRTDGTQQGTFEIFTTHDKDIRHLFVSSQNLLYFFVGRSAGNVTIWRSDGTLNNTFSLVDINVFHYMSSDVRSFFVEHLGKVFFGGIDKVENKAALFWSDGTISGTGVYHLFINASARRDPRYLASLPNYLFMDCSVSSSSTNREPCLTDGIGGEVSMLKKISVLKDSEAFRTGAIEFLGKTYFSGTKNTTRLWYSDLTGAGTLEIPTFSDGHPTSNPTGFASVGGKLIVSVKSSTTSNENYLYRSVDGVNFSRVSMTGGVVPLSTSEKIPFSQNYAIFIDPEGNLFASDGESTFKLNGLKASDSSASAIPVIKDGKLLATKQSGSTSRFVFLDLNNLNVEELGYQQINSTASSSLVVLGLAGAGRCILGQTKSLPPHYYHYQWVSDKTEQGTSLFYSSRIQKTQDLAVPLSRSTSNRMITLKPIMYRGREHILLSRLDSGSRVPIPFKILRASYWLARRDYFSIARRIISESKDLVFYQVEVSDDLEKATKVIRSDGTASGTDFERYGVTESKVSFALNASIPWEEKIYQLVFINLGYNNKNTGQYYAIFQDGQFTKKIRSKINSFDPTSTRFHASPQKVVVTQRGYLNLKVEFLNNLESTTEYDITIQGGLMFIELVGDTIYFGELLDNGTLFVKSIKPNGVVAILGEIQNSNSQPLNISLISASTYILLNINNKLFKISGNTISFLEEMCQTFIHDYRASYLPKIDTIYFGADDCQRRSLNGLELFKFNGTEISLVSEINPYQSGYHGYSALQCGGSLVFRGISPLYGRELFKLSIEDSCPTDPNKDSPGMCGCGIADLDLDNNGNTDCVNSTLIESVIEFPKDSQKFKLNAYRKGKKVFLELPKSDGAEYIYKYNLIKNGRKTRAKTIVKRSSKINIKKIPSNVHLHAKGGYLENGKKSKLSKTVKVL